MPESLEAKKAELESLYEEYKRLTTRMREILCEFPRAAQPLMDLKHGTAGAHLAIEILGKFSALFKEIEGYVALGADSNRAN